MFQVVIKGRFMTGTTQDDEEKAKETTVKLLKEKLASASCLEIDDIFQFRIDSVETEEL